MTPLRFETEADWMAFENTGRRPLPRKLRLAALGCLALALLATPALAVTAPEQNPGPLPPSAFERTINYWHYCWFRGGHTHDWLTRSGCGRPTQPPVVPPIVVTDPPVIVDDPTDTPTPIPLPASLALLLGSLASFALLGRRRG